MPQSTAEKLKIKDGMTLKTVNAPSNFKTSLGLLPDGVKISSSADAFDQVHWFVKSQQDIKENLRSVMALLKNGAVCWIYYPKLSSGIKTDLTRDKGWDLLLKEDMQWLSMISFDDTWTAFGMRQKTDDDKAKESAPRSRPGSDIINPTTKTIQLPEDVKKMFAKNKAESEYFNSLAFSHRREYIEWIVGAKKEDTRNARLEKMLAMLTARKKNPTDRS